LTQPIANGKYEIYLYLLENYRDNYRAMSVRLEGTPVVEKIGELPLGHWARYGPYPVTVADGALDIDIMNAGKGDPLLNGLAIYRISPPR